MINTIGRHPERASQDRALLDDLLRTQAVGVLSSVTPKGEPWAVPLLHALDADRILFHGSTGSGMLRHLAAGAPVVYTVFALDAWVIGHTTFSSSANYRSATIRGTVTNLDGDEKEAALDAFGDSLFPGRPDEVRPMSAKELSATLVCALPIVDGGWLYKARTGQASQPGEETDAWGGIVPVIPTLGEPARAPWSEAAVPASVLRLTARTMKS